MKFNKKKLEKNFKLQEIYIIQELVKEIEGTTKVLETTGKPKLFPRLESIKQQLTLCEKALAEYLETKRLAFPRFYFVSSTDLLDILSNGNQPPMVGLKVCLVRFVINHLINRSTEGNSFNETKYIQK